MSLRFWLPKTLTKSLRCFHDFPLRIEFLSIPTKSTFQKCEDCVSRERQCTQIRTKGKVKGSQDEEKHNEQFPNPKANEKSISLTNEKITMRSSIKHRPFNEIRVLKNRRTGDEE